MKKRTKYTNNPELSELKVVSDFLPTPEELAGAEETVKVTIGLNIHNVSSPASTSHHSAPFPTTND